MQRRVHRRLSYYSIKNLAGIELTPEAKEEILHLKHCVESESPYEYHYYFKTCDDYCVIEERAFDSYESLLSFIQQLNPDLQKTDVVEYPNALSGGVPRRVIYIVRE